MPAASNDLPTARSESTFQAIQRLFANFSFTALRDEPQQVQPHPSENLADAGSKEHELKMKSIIFNLDSNSSNTVSTSRLFTEGQNTGSALIRRDIERFPTGQHKCEIEDAVSVSQRLSNLSKLSQLSKSRVGRHKRGTLVKQKKQVRFLTNTAIDNHL